MISPGISALLVFAGGGLGALLRWFTNMGCNRLFQNSSFPVGTLLSNVVSCTIFAAALVLMLPKVKDTSHFQLFIFTGICGGYSTFSAFSYETWLLFKNGQLFFGMINIFLNLVLCIAVFFLMAKNSA